MPPKQNKPLPKVKKVQHASAARGFSWGIVLLSLVIAAGASAVALGIAQVPHRELRHVFGEGAPHPNKPYSSLMDFYRFYLTEHSDETNQMLHNVGTVIAALYLLFNLSLLMPIIAAVAVGIAVVPHLRHMPHGAVEGAAMVGTYLVLSVCATRSLVRPVLPLLVGYAFAWCGHFYFEGNKPATFLYPSYSFVCDWMMLLDNAIKAAREFA